MVVDYLINNSLGINIFNYCKMVKILSTCSCCEILVLQEIKYPEYIPNVCVGGTEEQNHNIMTEKMLISKLNKPQLLKLQVLILQ